MLDSRARELYQALRTTGFNQSAAGRVLGVSRETVRQRLLDVGGFAGLLAWAVNKNEASKEEANAILALVALAPANRKGANLGDVANDEPDANSSEIRHLTTTRGRPIFSTSMSATVAIPQSSTVRVEGQDREFAKRVALELSFKLGLPREDMSELVSRMIGYFRTQGEPAKVAEMLITAMTQQARAVEPNE